MIRFEKPMIGKLDDKIIHQDIGGKTIVIESCGTISYALDTPFDKMTIALYNFIMRRLEIVDEANQDMKLYYGHVGSLGYFVAEDEVSDLKEIEWKDVDRYL